MAKSLPSRDAILDILGKEDRALHAKEISRLLDVSEASYAGLLRQLDDLALNGLLTARDGHKFKLSKGTAGVRSARGNGATEEREGYVTIHPRGFGFVASAASPGNDVYVAKEGLGGAMHGDRVAVRVTARGSRGAEGQITKIIGRGVKRVAGVLRRRGRSAWLEPDDTRIRGPIALPGDIDTHGSEGNSGKDGDAAVVTLTRYPELPDEMPEGKLEAVLGTPGEISVEVAKILVRDQIEEVHSEEASAEAVAYGETVPVSMLEGPRTRGITTTPSGSSARNRAGTAHGSRSPTSARTSCPARGSTLKRKLEVVASIYRIARSRCCRARSRRTCARSCRGSCASASVPT
jgi:ribonuclease R